MISKEQYIFIKKEPEADTMPVFHAYFNLKGGVSLSVTCKA